MELCFHFIELKRRDVETNNLLLIQYLCYAFAVFVVDNVVIDISLMLSLS